MKWWQAWKRRRERKMLLAAVRSLAQQTGYKVPVGNEVNIGLSMLVLSLSLAQRGETMVVKWDGGQPAPAPELLH